MTPGGPNAYAIQIKSSWAPPTNLMAYENPGLPWRFLLISSALSFSWPPLLLRWWLLKLSRLFCSLLRLTWILVAVFVLSIKKYSHKAIIYLVDVLNIWREFCMESYIILLASERLSHLYETHSWFLASFLFTVSFCHGEQFNY